MAIRLYHAVNRFLKSVLALSVFFLLLALPINLISDLNVLSFILSYEFVVIFSFVSLLLSACLLIPIKFLRRTVKFLIAILALCYAYFYIGFSLEGEVIGKLVMHAICWIIAVSASCKEGGEDATDHRLAYQRNLMFFKKFTIFIGVVISISLIILFIVDYKLVQTSFLNILWILVLYFITELLLVRFSRDAIYVNVRALDHLSYVKDIVFFGLAASASVALFLIFKSQLDKLYVDLIAALNTFINNLIKMWKNFKDYILRIFEALAGKPPREDSAFFDDSITPDDVLDDFGMGDFNMEDIGGSLPNGGAGGAGGAGGDFSGNGEFGGIGSIGGINGLSGSGGGAGGSGNLGGSGIPGGLGGSGIQGGPGGLGLAGAVGSFISENGMLGVGENVEATQGNAAAVAFVRIEENATVYLKLKSFGNYNKQGWEEAEEYSEFINESYSMNYLMGESLKNRGYEDIAIEIMSLTGQYFLPDYIALGNYPYDIQGSDVKMSGDASKVYRLKFYNVDNAYVYGYVPTYLKEKELRYREFVYDNYTSLPESTKNDVLSFLNERGMVTSDYDSAISNIFSILNGYTYNLEYDKKLDDEADVVVSFLTEYKTGICQHFASSAVVMLRSMGIPARYVGGLYAGYVEAGDWQVVVANAAHAWVEVYRDDIGWVRFDPTQAAQHQGESLETTFGKTEYGDIINNGGMGGSGGQGGTGNEGGNGDNQGGSGNEGGNGGNQGGSGNEGGNGDNQGGSGNEGGNGDNQGGSGNEGGNGDNQGGSGNEGGNGGNQGGSGNEDDKNEDGTNDDSDDSKEEDDKEDEDLNEEIIIPELSDCSNFPWVPVAIVSGSLLAATFLTILIIRLKKKSKKIIKKKKVDKKNLSEERKQLMEAEENRVAKKIIRDNYKAFIKVAGRHGIRKYPIDTTMSLRAKYNTKLEPNEALEILTKLYRIARYDVNEKLTIDDANQSTICLDLLQKSFSVKKDDKKTK